MLAKMSSQVVSLLLCTLLAAAGIASAVPVVHEKIHYSAPFVLGPGDVTDRFDRIEWPQGHIGLRSFHGEVVDEWGNSVLLSDVYLHHWLVIAYNVKKGFTQLTSSVPKTLDMTQHHSRRIPFQEEAGVEPREEAEGTCNDDGLVKGFGAGSETRRSKYGFPAPYAQSYGNPADIPEGYEEAVYLNVHAIDTRGAVSKTSCLECLCDAYGVTENSKGEPLAENYRGGLYCCYDKTHCAVQDAFNGEKKTYSLKYTIEWVDWDSSVIPVRAYGFDITDPRTSLFEKPTCHVEYEVPGCDPATATNGCSDHRRSIGAVPIGGDLISARMHQHNGAMGGMIYYKNGAPICVSEPIYGEGNEPGDEAGYVVGMTSCYPEPGTVKLESMKEITFEAWYSNEKSHTGVMSIFGVYVADPVDYKVIQEVTDPSL